MAPAEEVPHTSVKPRALMVLMGCKLSIALKRNALADVERRAKACPPQAGQERCLAACGS